MSIETDIITKFGTLMGGRLFWDTAPEGWSAAQMDAPFAIVQQVGGKRLKYVDDTQQPEYLNAHLQVVMWGRVRTVVSDKMREFAAAVVASNTPEFYAEVVSEAVGDWNEVLKLRGMRQDFSFWWKKSLYVGP